MVPASPEGKSEQKPESNEVAGATAKAASNLPQWWPWLVGGSAIFHLLEIVGIVFAFRGLFRRKDENTQNTAQIKGLVNKLNHYEEHQRNQAAQLSKISTELATTRALSSQVNALDRRLATQQSVGVGNVPQVPTPHAHVVEAPPPIVKPAYPFLDLYRQSSESFKNQYSPSTVSEDAENLQNRWAGNQQEIILGEERQGNYWVFHEGHFVYLIPSPKLKVNDMNMRTAGGLFDCPGYHPGYGTMTIVQPAIVSVLPGTNRRWKLEQKGVLEFT